MRLRFCAAALSTLLATAATAESLRIEPKHASFDAATASSTVRQTYTVTNTGDKTVRIRDWKAIAGHGQLKLPETLAPGEKTTFELELALPSGLGQVLHRFAVFTDEPDVERYRFTLGGFVYSLLTPAPAVADLGTLRFDSTQTHSLEFEAREEDPLVMGRIISAPDWLDVSVEGRTLRSRLRKGVNLGIHVGSIRIATNLPAQPFVDVGAKAIVSGDLRPSVYGLGIRPVHVNEKAEASIEMTHANKADLSKLAVHAPDGWTITRGTCIETKTASTCARITLSKVMTTSGRGNETIRFELPGEPTLVIPFGTVALGAEQTMRELVLDENGDAPPQKFDIGDELAKRAAVAPTKAPAVPAGKKISHAEGKGPVRLQWQAANDGKIFGYMVYRAGDRAGPVHRVSATPVRTRHAAGVPAERAEYVFVDDAIKTGQTYYYYIDAIATNGAQSRFSPVMSKKVLGD